MIIKVNITIPNLRIQLNRATFLCFYNIAIKLINMLLIIGHKNMKNHDGIERCAMVTNKRIVFIGFILNVMCLRAMEEWGKYSDQEAKPVIRSWTNAQPSRGNEAYDDKKMTEMIVFRSDNDIVEDPLAFQEQRRSDIKGYCAKLESYEAKKLCTDLERICSHDDADNLLLLKSDMATTIVGKFAGKAKRKKYIPNVLKAAESIDNGKASNYIAVAQEEYVAKMLKGELQAFILNHNAVGKCVELIKTLETGDVAAIDCSPNGQTFVVGDLDGDVRIYTMDGACIKELSNEEPDIGSIRFSPDGKTIAAWFVGGYIKRWDTESGNLIKDVKFNFKVHDSHQNTRVISFSPDTSCIASTCNGKKIKIWDIDSAECKIIDDTAYALCFYPDGSRIVYATPTEIKVMHIELQKWLRTIPYNTGPNDYRLLSVSHDGVLLAVSGNEYERLPDGELQYVASGDGINVYDILSKPTRVMSTGSGLTCLNPIYFSPKETLFVSWDDELFKLWHTRSKQCTNLKSHDDDITAVCFSREGDNILSSYKNGVTLIHKLENFKTTFKLPSLLFLLHFVHNNCTISKDIALSPHQEDLISQFLAFYKELKEWKSPSTGQ